MVVEFWTCILLSRNTDRSLRVESADACQVGTPAETASCGGSLLPSGVQSQWLQSKYFILDVFESRKSWAHQAVAGEVQPLKLHTTQMASIYALPKAK